MYRIFNMLIQNLKNMGANITEIAFKEEYLSIEFTDSEGNEFEGWIRRVEEIKNA